jgi:hypothetical protein
MTKLAVQNKEGKIISEERMEHVSKEKMDYCSGFGAGSSGFSRLRRTES